jgi:hypothetical protein
MSEAHGTLWDAVRSWADSVGLLRSSEGGDAAARPHVPESVCANCPICQGAATLDQVDTEALAEWAELARGVIAGMGSALASAAEQRIQGHSTHTDELGDVSPADGKTDAD